jgi:hypothetical protein
MGITIFILKFIKVIYKLFYFYLMPICVIPVGYFGWKMNLEEEEGFMNWSDQVKAHFI